MSCYSWSLPAGPTYCAGFRGTTCAQCYAGQGRYRMPNVERAQRIRWDWWRTASNPERIRVMSYAIARKLRKQIESGTAYFRVFDSGDFSNPRDVETWIEIARALPQVKFWIPTRCWWLPEFQEPLRRLHALPNVTVRASALDVDGVNPDWPTVSRVVSDGPGCPKQTHGNCEAAGCRACWSKDVPSIEYRQHGHRVNWKRRAA